MAREPVEARQTAILEATCRVLIERGFAALRIQDVARQLGVSTGLIHYHFESKEQLLEAALRLAGQADLDQLRADVAEARGPVAKLDAYFQAYCPKGAEPGWLLWIDAWGESLRRPELRRISQEFDEASVQVVEDVIAARRRRRAPSPRATSTPRRGASPRWSTASPCRCASTTAWSTGSRCSSGRGRRRPPSSAST